MAMDQGPAQDGYDPPVESEPGYRLIDAGDRRRLEQFGVHLIDRPAPQARQPRRLPAAWTADLRYERGSGWTMAGETIDPGDIDAWPVSIAGLTMEVRPTPNGQLGIFPEHTASLAWLDARLEAARRSGGPPLVLNLFAHTGLITLGLARAGATVVHVDASRPAVAWARRNARHSGLDAAPVRWIVDDVERFVARELRRGHRYAGVVLDPPSWGHGTSGRGVRHADRLARLLTSAFQLTAATRGFCLLTGHTTGHARTELAAAIASAMRPQPGGLESGDLDLTAESGAVLHLGAYARVSR